VNELEGLRQGPAMEQFGQLPSSEDLIFNCSTEVDKNDKATGSSIIQ